MTLLDNLEPNLCSCRYEAEREKKLMSKMLNSMQNGPEDTANAVCTIQRYYRGFKARKLVANMKYEEMVFLGMEEPPEKEIKNDPIWKQVNNRERRKILQKQFEEDYLQALVATKEKILRMEGPDMREAIQDEFRQWYMEYKRINGKFPDFPAEEVWKEANFKFSIENSGEVKPVEEEKTEKEAGKKDKKNDKKEEEAEDPSEKFKEFSNSEFLVNGAKQ